MITKQHEAKLSNHEYSEKSKAPTGRIVDDTPVQTGNLIYMYCDKDKHRGRDTYLVVSTDGVWCYIKGH